jgi:hypothetical protein
MEAQKHNKFERIIEIEKKNTEKFLKQKKKCQEIVKEMKTKDESKYFLRNLHNKKKNMQKERTT